MAAVLSPFVGLPPTLTDAFMITPTRHNQAVNTEPPMCRVHKSEPLRGGPVTALNVILQKSGAVHPDETPGHYGRHRQWGPQESNLQQPFGGGCTVRLAHHMPGSPVFHVFTYTTK